MASKTVRVWTGGSASSKDTKLYTSLSSINTAINNAGLPNNCVITSAKLKVNAGYSGGISPKVYMTFGLGNTSEFKVTLFSRAQISNGSTYPSSGVEIINYFADKAGPGFALNLANYGSYFVVRLDTTYITKLTLKVNWVDIDITYKIPKYTITTGVSPEGAGTVTGGGSYEKNTEVKLTATPNSGYKFVKWSDENTSNPRTVTASGNATYTAVFEKLTYTITFKNADGSVVSTKTLNSGATLGTLPTVSRSGYTFGGWIPCAPAIKTDGSVLDSYQYNGSTAYPLNTKYKYTNKFAIHIEAYMDDWSELKTLNAQIMSCTEGGGWGLGYQARSGTTGGTEIHNGSGYKIIDLGFASDEGLKALNNNTDKNKNWHSVDLVFSEGTYQAYLDGVDKGTQTLSSTSLSYHSSNTIFVGAEAGSNTTTPVNGYFKGFISNVFIANQGTKLQIATTSTVVNSNIEYYPIWRKNITFTATFKNHDGTVLQTVSVEHGSTPNYTGSIPTKPSTAEYNYSFSGWSPSIGAITSNTTYTAQFTATKRKYTINTLATNGVVSGGGTYEYGTSITLIASPADGYKFEKWSDGNTQYTRDITVTGDATYEAQFRLLVLKFKSVKIYYPTGANVASPTNPLDAGQSAQIVVQVALE